MGLMEPVDASETERRAIELVYEKKFGLALGHDAIPASESQEILNEIRERAQRLEQLITQEVLASRIPKGRRIPRSQVVASVGAAIIVSVIGLVFLVVTQLFFRK